MANDALLLSTQEIRQVLDVWDGGGCIGMPTETVYGLAADATNDSAVAGIFALKNRPQFNPLIIHLFNSDMVKEYIQWNDLCEKLSGRFWPGPLTIIRPKLNECSVSDLCSSGGDTLAVRCPKHPVARQLLEAFGKPVAAPSANVSGRISPTTSAHVYTEFVDSLHVVEGGPCEKGLESTVLWVGDDHVSIIRPGSITQSDIEALGIEVRDAADSHSKASPGQLSSHYAPTLPLRMNAQSADAGEAFLGFGQCEGTLNLSHKGDLQEAAANLFAYMRRLDSADYTAIAVAPIPEEGLGVAINDRLRRAAAPRG